MNINKTFQMLDSSTPVWVLLLFAFAALFFMLAVAKYDK